MPCVDIRVLSRVLVPSAGWYHPMTFKSIASMQVNSLATKVVCMVLHPYTLWCNTQVFIAHRTESIVGRCTAYGEGKVYYALVIAAEPKSQSPQEPPPTPG